MELLPRIFIIRKIKRLRFGVLNLADQAYNLDWKGGLYLKFYGKLKFPLGKKITFYWVLKRKQGFAQTSCLPEKPVVRFTILKSSL